MLRDELRNTVAREYIRGLITLDEYNESMAEIDREEQADGRISVPRARACDKLYPRGNH